MKICDECGIELKDNISVCTNCGCEQREILRERKDEIHFCEMCDERISASDLTCPSCGQKQKNVRLSNSTVKQGKKSVKVVFGLVFSLVAIFVGLVVFINVVDRSDEAIDIAKNSELYYEGETTADTIDSFMNDDEPDTIYGWEAYYVENDIYFVEFAFDENDDSQENGYSLYAFEVNIETEEVYFVVGNEKLEEKYRDLDYIE